MKITSAKIIKLESKDKYSGDVQDLQIGSRWLIDVEVIIEGHAEPYVANLQVRYVPELEEPEIEQNYELLGVYLADESKDQVPEIKEQLDSVQQNIMKLYVNLLQVENIDFERLYVALETTLRDFSPE
ncbi:hypothetical protein ACF3MZ_11175 [Paenibacillaceae bacterium WGS1546]|uniref:hypothetical protein n=1 Tax=Cohnella sp. WGS1546 TaxID=3366810 RepID=UPI00372CFDBA